MKKKKPIMYLFDELWLEQRVEDVDDATDEGGRVEVVNSVKPEGHAVLGSKHRLLHDRLRRADLGEVAGCEALEVEYTRYMYVSEEEVIWELGLLQLP